MKANPQYGFWSIFSSRIPDTEDSLICGACGFVVMLRQPKRWVNLVQHGVRWHGSIIPNTLGMNKADRADYERCLNLDREAEFAKFKADNIARFVSFY